MKRIFLLLVSALSLALSAQAQGEWNNWYFGVNRGLTFNGGGPFIVTGGQTNTFEGSASFSNGAGQLLFYSDGQSIWNRIHNPMPNGGALLGNSSSTQSALIVPRPGNPNRYFLFTTDALENNNVNGVCYSEIDMTLDGGFGDIIAQTKNTPLLQPAGEKLTGYKKADGTGYWVVGHKIGTNEYCSWEVTATGVNATPVVSAVGITQNEGLESTSSGYLKISPDGKKICDAIEGANLAQLMDFNAATGQISNLITLNFPDLSYGVEFSPDSKKLYISVYQAQQIYQFDLSSGNPNTIIGSQTLIAPFTGGQCGSMLLGPDGKIYIAQLFTGYLSVIENPNGLADACQYNENGPAFDDFFNLSIGLPNVITLALFAPPDPCLNNNLKFFSVFKKSYVCTDCFDGKIAASAIGGTKPYTYSINGEDFLNSGVFTGLVPGIYTITVKDANGCTITRTVKIGG